MRRTDSDFVVIARTDAIAVEGFDVAMDRAAMYEEAGADMLFVEAPTDTRQLAKIGSNFSVPHVANLASSRRTPLLPAEELGELGFKLVIYPGLLLLSTIRAALSCLDHLKEKRTWAGMEADLPTFDEMLTLMGMEEVESLEERYALPEQGGSTMKVGVFLGSQHPPEADIRREFEHMVEQTRAIRDAGFDSLWLGQHYLTYPNQFLQTTPLLARLAAETGDMAVGTNMILLPLHNVVDYRRTVCDDGCHLGGAPDPGCRARVPRHRIPGARCRPRDAVCRGSRSRSPP